MNKQNVNIISAMCKGRGIGFKNRLPWDYRKELLYFKRMTSSCNVLSMNALIMGRNTFQSLPGVLGNRTNYVISSELEHKNVYRSLEDCIEHCKRQNYEKIWIIGGQKIYEYALEQELVDRIYLTLIHKKYECDTFFPEIPTYFKQFKTTYEVENNTELQYNIYHNTKTLNLDDDPMNER